MNVKHIETTITETGGDVMTRSERIETVCSACGAPEVEVNSPRTVYACGGSDYDKRPGTALCPSLHWRCEQCGAVEAVESTGGFDDQYTEGDTEPCVDCYGCARVVSVPRGASAMGS